MRLPCKAGEAQTLSALPAPLPAREGWGWVATCKGRPAQRRWRSRHTRHPPPTPPLQGGERSARSPSCRTVPTSTVPRPERHDDVRHGGSRTWVRHDGRDTVASVARHRRAHNPLSYSARKCQSGPMRPTPSLLPHPADPAPPSAGSRASRFPTAAHPASQPWASAANTKGSSRRPVKTPWHVSTFSTFARPATLRAASITVAHGRPRWSATPAWHISTFSTFVSTFAPETGDFRGS